MKEYTNYLQFLAAKYNILYIGESSDEIYEETSSYFKSNATVDITQEILIKIEDILQKRSIDVIVLDVGLNDTIAIKFFDAIKAFDENILIMLMFTPKERGKLCDIMPFVDAPVSYPLEKNLLEKKMFTILSRTYAINSIGRRDIALKSENVKENATDEFFDTYEGSSLFIADDLVTMVDDLNAGNLTEGFFINIAKDMDKVADIFSKAKETTSVTVVYEGLATYLREIDLQTIEPQNLKGFTYLSQILSDVSVYLIDMFVDRIFRDVYIFKDSLQNNITFMKNTLSGIEEEEGELDFF